MRCIWQEVGDEAASFRGGRAGCSPGKGPWGAVEKIPLGITSEGGGGGLLLYPRSHFQMVFLGLLTKMPH